MNSIQLRYSLLKLVDIPTTVCAIDQLQVVKKEPFAIICNNQRSTMPGMHWISFYKNNCDLEFFDSFGMPVEFYGKEFHTFITRFGKKVNQSFTQFQSDSSNLCGGYGLYFLINRDRGKTYNQILSSFSPLNTRTNDLKIKSFTKQNIIFPKFAKCGTICSARCLHNLSSVCLQESRHCKRLSRELVQE